MSIGTGVIITMTSVTISSAVVQKVFSSIGKNDEAQYLDVVTKCGLGATSLGFVGILIKAILNLG